MAESLPEVYLARHGETAWTLSGQNTGRTDLPLTERGERNASSLAGRLRGIDFARDFVSSLVRARRTSELAGFGAAAEVVPDLAEWDYGSYEGRQTAEIGAVRPPAGPVPRRRPSGRVDGRRPCRPLSSNRAERRS